MTVLIGTCTAARMSAITVCVLVHSVYFWFKHAPIVR
jgi:hypothetical protein